MSREATIGKRSELVPETERTRGGDVYRPNVDILEKQDELLVVADLPGVKGNDVDIRFEDGELTIRGPAAARQDGVRYLLQEYGVGDFYRTFRVSERIDAAKISAEHQDGVLLLHLPKVEAAKPRKIEVKTK
jgi:HSP20 family protein